MKNVRTVCGDGIAISSDGVRTIKGRRQKELVKASRPTDLRNPKNIRRGDGVATY
ncbi:hypothetical protein Tco_0022233, partial [Tanacetum coccineum]